jgi:hypothetical protein
VRLLSKEDIEGALADLAAELPVVASTPREIFLVGGAAMAVLFSARRTTEDVDVVMAKDDQRDVLAAAARVAARRGLSARWLSDQASRFVSRRSDGAVVLSTPSLRVKAAAPEHLLALKLAAWRGELDIADAKVLLGRIQGGFEEVWSLVGGYLDEGPRESARWFFEDLWEVERGPR